MAVSALNKESMQKAVDESAATDSAPVATNNNDNEPRHVKTFAELLMRLKEEYMATLRRSVTYASDEFGLRHGFFSAADNTRLYLPEAKLQIIALEVGDETINEWIRNARESVLKPVAPGAPQMAAAYNMTLNRLCAELKQSLSDDIVFYQYQGVMVPSISDDNKKKLHRLARQIVEVGKLLAQDRYPWLVKTWQDFERAHQTQ